MTVLGIESSCDETSAAVVTSDGEIRSLVVASQSEIHARYHGVVPEVASRAHVEQILPVVRQALRESQSPRDAIDAVAVTNRPGLSGSLAVGVSFAKGWSLATGIPLVTVDHMAAHAYAARLASREDPLPYPYLVLLVSGGHTMLAQSVAPEELHVLGTTIDDACGEAYDKVSAFLELGYPGGPAIDRLAASGDHRAYTFPTPRPGSRAGRYDLSYSGLKTAVVYQREKFWNQSYPQTRENIAAAFQHRAISMLMERLRLAMADTGIPRVAVGGGVAANSLLRRELEQLAMEDPAYRVVLPPPLLCLDNAAMVAGLGAQAFAARGGDDLSVGVSARVSEFRGSGLSPRR